MDIPTKTESLDFWLETLPARCGDFCRRVGRPLVTLSYAQSLDGSISLRRGQPLPLSGPQSMQMTHRLRSVHEGILVGIGTVLADDPQLSVRLIDGPSPRPVVLDTHLRFPLQAHLLNRVENLPWIFCAPDASAARRAALAERGARVFTVSQDASGRLNLHGVLAHLAHEGVSALMVEGGAQVITQFLAEELVDQVVITTAPVWVGGLRAVGDLASQPARRLELVEPFYTRLGADLITWGAVGPQP